MTSEHPAPPAYRLSSAVFAERDGKILLLKRAMGEATGGWYLPGGALDAGEDIETCARRELFEECGLRADGPLTCVGVAHMHVYGYDSLQVLYAAPCPDGDVVLSPEHSAFRWMDAREYRERYFNDDNMAQFAKAAPRAAEMLANIRRALDAYLSFCALREAAAR